jgi:hypothetical protein
MIADTRKKTKEVLRLLDDLEALIPEIRAALARRADPSTGSLIERLDSLHARSIRLRQETDCLPAAELGRKGTA